MPRLRQYIVPAIILTLAIFVCYRLVATEVVAETYWAIPAYPAFPQHLQRGWPVVFSEISTRGSGLITTTKTKFSNRALFADIAIAVAIITLLTIVLIWWIRRPHSWRFSLRAVLIATACIAAICGWFVWAKRSWQKEQDAIAAVQVFCDHAGGFSYSYCGPQWLRRFTPWPSSPFFPDTDAIRTAVREQMAIFERATEFTFGSPPISGPAPNITLEKLKQLTAAFSEIPYLTNIDLPDDYNLPYAPDEFAKWRNIGTVTSSNCNQETLECIARIPRLRKLTLYSREVSDRTLTYLTNCQHLEVLTIEFGEQVTDASIDLLCNLKSLEKLWVWRTHISDQGARRLLALRKLECLVPPEQISDETRQQFKMKIIAFTDSFDGDD